MLSNKAKDLAQLNFFVHGLSLAGTFFSAIGLTFMGYSDYFNTVDSVSCAKGFVLKSDQIYLPLMTFALTCWKSESSP